MLCPVSPCHCLNKHKYNGYIQNLIHFHTSPVSFTLWAGVMLIHINYTDGLYFGIQTRSCVVQGSLKPLFHEVLLRSGRNDGGVA